MKKICKASTSALNVPCRWLTLTGPLHQQFPVKIDHNNYIEKLLKGLTLN